MMLMTNVRRRAGRWCWNAAPARNSFCPTGPGGGVDPTCSPGNKLLTEKTTFKKWFSGSKVTDDFGNPLVVYHGTDADFDKFSIKRFNKKNPVDDPQNWKGIYFDSDPRAAADYARGGESANVKPVYLALKNPAVGQIVFPMTPKEALEAGHDGMIRVKPDGNKEYVVFKAGQIRSSITGNVANAVRRDVLDPLHNEFADPLRVDPSRTFLIRRRFAGDLRRRLDALRRDVRQFLIEDDELGLVADWREKQAANAFCATGKGGGIDPTCSPSSRPVGMPVGMNEHEKNLWDEATKHVPKALLAVADVRGFHLGPISAEPGSTGGLAKRKEVWVQAGGKQTALHEVMHLAEFGLHNDERTNKLMADLRADLIADERMPGQPREKLTIFMESLYSAPGSLPYRWSHQEVPEPNHSQRLPEYRDRFLEIARIVANASENHTGKMLHEVQALSVPDANESGGSMHRQERPTTDAGQAFPVGFDARLGRVGTGRRVRQVPAGVIGNAVTNARRFRFASTPEKLAAFRKFLAARMKLQGLLFQHAEGEDAWWRRYIEETYRKGQGRSFDDAQRKRSRPDPASKEQLGWYKGTREQFLRDSFRRPATLERVKVIAGRAYDSLKGFSDEMATKTQRVLTDGLIKGEHPKVLAKQLADQIGVSESRAEMIARTEVVHAQAEGQLDALENLGIAEVGVAVEWSTAGDDAVCPKCRPLEGVIFKVEEAHGLIPRHPNCLPGDVLVLPGSTVSAASERFYDGDLIVFRTASGRELSCTPNHPVLTDFGWVPARLLDVGSNVVCDGRREWEAVIDDDHQDVPTSIKDVAKSLAGSGEVTASEVPTSTPDFHGDGIEGEVAVVWTDGVLGSAIKPPVLEHSGKFGFQAGDVMDGVALPRNSGHSQFGVGSDAASCGFIGGTDLCPALATGHARPFNDLGLALIPSGDAPLQDDPSYAVPGDLISLGDGILGIAGQVVTDDLALGKCRGSGARNVLISEHADDDLVRDTELASQLANGDAGPVFFDEVVSFVIKQFAGHVYNLQTEGRWYSANGIITHNCRCSFIPAGLGEDDEEQQWKRKDVERAIRESLEEDGDKTTWPGADLEIDADRPEPVFKAGEFKQRSTGAKGTEFQEWLEEQFKESGYQNPEEAAAGYRPNAGTYWYDRWLEEGGAANCLAAFDAAMNAFCPTGEGGGQDNSCPPNSYKSSGERLPSVVYRGASGENLEESADWPGAVYVSTDKATSEQWGDVHERVVTRQPKLLDLGDWYGPAKVIVARLTGQRAADMDRTAYDTAAGDVFLQGEDDTIAALKKWGYDGMRHGNDALLIGKLSDYTKPAKAVANAFCPTGEGGGQDNSCSSAGSSTEDVLAAKAGDRKELVLYRAADDDSFGDTASFSESRDDAEFYKNNPGFGGSRLYKTSVSVDSSKLLDLGEADDAVEKLAGILGKEVPSRGSFEHGRREDELVPLWASELSERGIEWVRVRESNPPDSHTWIWTGAGDEPEMKELYADNAFCPTGPGGGQDNSCPPGNSSGRSGSAPGVESKEELLDYVEVGDEEAEYADLERAGEEWMTSLDPKERSAVLSYRDAGRFKKINKYMRDGTAGSPGSTRKAREDAAYLHAALDRSHLPEGVDVYRGISGKFDLKEGDTFLDSSFMSASPSSSIAAAFVAGEPGVLFKLTTGGGVKGAYIAGRGKEPEVLVQSSTPVEITKVVRLSGGQLYVEGKLMGSKTENAFCPTGPGGGQDNSCSSAGSSTEDVLAAKAGDRDALARVVEQNQGLVRQLARKNARGDRQLRDDLISEGNLGLLRAVEKFDPEKGAKFVTYAHQWINGVQRNEVRRQGKERGKSKELSLDPEDLSGGTHEADEARAEVGRALKSLDARSADILRESYGVGGDEPRTDRDIAERLGITPARVGQIKKAALAKLRELQPVAANLLVNVFCPNGPGGGVDPSCPAGGSKMPGKDAGPVKVFGGSPMERMGSRVVAEYFPSSNDADFYGIKIVGEEHGFAAGKDFQAGGKSFVTAGEYDPAIRAVTSKAEPGIMSHELGHDEFHRILDESQHQLNGAALWMEGNSKDVFDDYIKPDGMIRNPTSSREEVYNSLQQFQSSLETEDDFPSDYARSWRKESVVDFPRTPAKKFPRVEEGQKTGEFSFDVRAHRSVNEAYAEFCRGLVLDSLVKSGLALDIEGRPTFKKMGTPKSRKAFLDLRKKSHQLFKEG